MGLEPTTSTLRKPIRRLTATSSDRHRRSEHFTDVGEYPRAPAPGSEFRLAAVVHRADALIRESDYVIL